MAAASHYEIEMRANGTIDRITKDRRAFAYDLDDVDEALARIRRDEGTGFHVTVIEPDGYPARAVT